MERQRNMTPNEVREKVNQLGEPAMLLCQEVLDTWMEYVRDEDRLIYELDSLHDMAHDIRVFQSRLGDIAFSGDFRTSGGGKL